MEQSVAFNRGKPALGADQDTRAALPLYVASLVVTLAGVGAVGVTISEPSWTPQWVLLAIVGHLVSFWLRLRRVSAGTIFYPVMLLGAAVVLQQSIIGGYFLGMSGPLRGQAIDMGTAMVVAMLAVLRTFTLVNNGTLLFSPVPTITMMALVGSTNPNAEVPVFFGLSLLGALFITSYESYLRRVRRRESGIHLTYYLLSAWAFTLGVCVCGLLFPLFLQPFAAKFSPYYWSSMNRLRGMTSFLNYNQNQAPVGQGPIRLSPNPVYEVYTQEPGKLRTSVFTRYNGREWRAVPGLPVADLPSRGEVTVPVDLPSLSQMSYTLGRFDVPLPVPDVPKREVRQRFVTLGAGVGGIPVLGTPKQLLYPAQRIYLTTSGTLGGGSHQTPGRYFEVRSTVFEVPPDRLRSVKPIDPKTFSDPDTLDLPNSAMPVIQLAREITKGIDNPYDQIQAIIHHIETNCSYTLEEEVTPAGVDAAVHYLFNSKRGACDLAATATAVMCRSIGIPARVAVGYVLDEPLDHGEGFLVRQAHAHMWVEAYFNHYGWVPFDPAPAAVSLRENPLATAWFRIRSLFAKIGGGGLDAVLLVLVVLGTAILVSARGWGWLRALWLRKQQRKKLLSTSPHSVIVEQYNQALRMLQRRGWPREHWMTPREYLSGLTEQMADYDREPGFAARRETTLAALGQLTHGVEAALYARDGGDDRRAEVEQALRELQKATPCRPRKRSVAPASVSSVSEGPN